MRRREAVAALLVRGLRRRRRRGRRSGGRATGSTDRHAAARRRQVRTDRRPRSPGAMSSARPAPADGSEADADRRRGSVAVGDSDGSGHRRRQDTGRPAPRPSLRELDGISRPETQKSWRRPIFPKGCPLSIFGAGELDFRVRDGNGYGLSASVTRISCVWMLFGCDRRGPKAGAGAVESSIFDVVESRRGSIHDSQPLTPGQLLKRSSPRPLVPLSFIRHRTSTCGLSNRWSPCGLTRLTRWGTSS